MENILTWTKEENIDTLVMGVPELPPSNVPVRCLYSHDPWNLQRQRKKTFEIKKKIFFIQRYQLQRFSNRRSFGYKDITNTQSNLYGESYTTFA